MKVKWLLLMVCGLAVSVMNRGWGVSPLISTTSPFTGTMHEGWESFPAFTGVYPPGPVSIMGGQAAIASPVLAFYAPQQASLGTSGIAQITDGVRGLMINQFNQVATITWNTPILRFGGYFGEATLPPGYNKDPNIITINFYGQGNALIDTEVFNYSHSATADGGLDWHGWNSTTPIFAISIQGDDVAMDSLQASAIPEPRCLPLAAMCAGGILAFKNRMRHYRSLRCGAGKRFSRLVLPAAGGFLMACTCWSQSFDFENVSAGYYPSGLALAGGGQTLTITTEGYPSGWLLVSDPNVALLGFRSCLASQVDPLSAGHFSPVRFTFGVPLSSVSLAYGDAGGDNDSPVTISAFDTANHLLGTVTDSYPAYYADGKQVDLNFNGMKYLVMTSAGGENNDNSLNWEVIQSTPIPEPGTFSILTLAALGFINPGCHKQRRGWAAALRR